MLILPKRMEHTAGANVCFAWEQVEGCVVKSPKSTKGAKMYRVLRINEFSLGRRIHQTNVLSVL